MSAIEGALLKTAHAGHWHDAEVRVDGDAILVSYRDEEKISGFRENRTEALLLAPRAASKSSRFRKIPPCRETANMR